MKVLDPNILGKKRVMKSISSGSNTHQQVKSLVAMLCTVHKNRRYFTSRTWKRSGPNTTELDGHFADINMRCMFCFN